jgi:hypothetical protein
MDRRFFLMGLLLVLAACGDGPTGPPRSSQSVQIPVAYLTQATQNRDGTVPLVADLDAYVRVFVVAGSANTLQPDVRVRLFHNEALVHTVVIPASGPGIPTAVDQSSMTMSWNAPIAGALIQPGLRMLVDVDPAGAELAPAFFPANGTPRPIHVAKLPAFRARLVPIHQSSTGLTGRVDATNMHQFLSLASKIYPMSGYDVDLREPFTTSIAPLDPGGTFWGALVSELDAARIAEGSDRYWYGVVRVPYGGGGVMGIAAGVPSRTALGADVFPGAEEIYAHELGHNWGRFHAPCGGAAGNDPAYPYTLGMIGVWGMDVAKRELKRPASFTDIMGYCIASWWISDYTYTRVLQHRQQVDGGTMAGAAQPSLLVWGRIEEGQLVLEPAFEVDAPPSSRPAPGPYRVQGVDGDGNVLFSVSFAGQRIPDIAGDHRTFAFTVPFPAAVANRLAEIRLHGGDRQVQLRSRVGAPEAGARAGRQTPPSVTVTRGAGDAVSMRWDADRHPVIMVRDAASGAVLGFARGGESVLRAADRDLELVLSTGVGSQSVRAGTAPAARPRD